MTMREKVKQAFSYSFSRQGKNITQTISDNFKINLKVFAPCWPLLQYGIPKQTTEHACTSFQFRRPLSWNKLNLI